MPTILGGGRTLALQLALLIVTFLELCRDGEGYGRCLPAPYKSQRRPLAFTSWFQAHTPRKVPTKQTKSSLANNGSGASSSLYRKTSQEKPFTFHHFTELLYLGQSGFGQENRSPPDIRNLHHFNTGDIEAYVTDSRAGGGQVRGTTVGPHKIGTCQACREMASQPFAEIIPASSSTEVNNL